MSEWSHITAEEWERQNAIFKWLQRGWGERVAWTWLAFWVATKRKQAP